MALRARHIALPVPDSLGELPSPIKGPVEDPADGEADEAHRQHEAPNITMSDEIDMGSDMASTTHVSRIEISPLHSRNR
jgi:hypothetical protein